MKKTTNIINKIKEGDESEIIALYQKYKNDFMNWAKFKFQLDHDTALDIFQEAVIGFYDDIKQEKLTEIKHSVKTYLFAIAKNMIYNKLRYEKRFNNENNDFDGFHASDDPDESLMLTERKKVMINMLSELGEPCHTILKLFYFDGYSMDGIAGALDYKNADVVKSQKLRCLNELRRRIMTHFKKDEI